MGPIRTLTGAQAEWGLRSRIYIFIVHILHEYFLGRYENVHIIGISQIDQFVWVMAPFPTS